MSTEAQLAAALADKDAQIATLTEVIQTELGSTASIFPWSPPPPSPPNAPPPIAPETIQPSGIIWWLAVTLFLWLLPPIGVKIYLVRKRRRIKAEQKEKRWLYSGTNDDAQDTSSSRETPGGEDAARNESFEQAIKTFAEAEAAAHQRYFRVCGALAQLGWMSFVFGFIPFFVTMLDRVDFTDIDLFPGEHSRIYHYFTWPSIIGQSVMMMAIRPIDTELIRFAAFASITIMLPFFIVYGINVYHALMNPARGYGTLAFIILCLYIRTFVFLWPELNIRCPGQVNFEPKHPRVSLQDQWKILRQCWFYMGIVVLAMWFLVLEPVEEGSISRNVRVSFQVLWLPASALIIMAIVTGRKTRGRFLRFIGSLGEGKGSAEQKAASVASLVSGGGAGSAAEALSNAARLLRAQPLSTLSRKNLANSKPDPTLYADSVPAKFGDLHAFMSHSWSDDGDIKYDKLHEWDRERGGDGDEMSPSGAPGSEALIWLDKSCINQQSINESLAALPIFLAACQKLLILAGPTYSSRLWCVMEIFVFLRVNGKGEDLVVKLLSEHTNLIESLQTFKAEKARTFLEGDRQRLLAIIESAFGAFTPFDKIVRGAFDDKLSEARGINPNSTPSPSFKRRLSTTVRELVKPTAMPTELGSIDLEENSEKQAVMDHQSAREVELDNRRRRSSAEKPAVREVELVVAK